ncbi:MAG: signal peptidase I [Pseudomonadota bacterium]|jgi:signal peptidase I
MENLDLDFAALLVGLTAFTGLVWAIDHLLFRRRRLAGNADAREPVIVEYCRSFFPVILAVLVIRSFLAEPFRIPSSSMMPTLLVGDFILVNKFAYGIRLPVSHHKLLALGEPRRGDVVVFRFPQDPRIDYIKRVVGLPGDRVSYRDKIVYVNDQAVAQEQIGAYRGEGAGAEMTGSVLKIERLFDIEHQILQRRSGSGFYPVHEGPWTVPAGHYFVLGDNRDNSQDSRFWGFVPEENLVGKAFLIWMNWDLRNGGVDFGRIGTVIK